MLLQLENASHLKRIDRAHWGHKILLCAHLFLIMCSQVLDRLSLLFIRKWTLTFSLWNPRYKPALKLFYFPAMIRRFFVNGNHVLHFNLCCVISIINLFKLVYIIYLCDNDDSECMFGVGGGDYYYFFLASVN